LRRSAIMSKAQPPLNMALSPPVSRLRSSPRYLDCDHHRGRVPGFKYEYDIRQRIDRTQISANPAGRTSGQFGTRAIRTEDDSFNASCVECNLFQGGANLMAEPRQAAVDLPHSILSCGNEKGGRSHPSRRMMLHLIRPCPICSLPRSPFIGSLTGRR
jgi:hypothetical protein